MLGEFKGELDIRYVRSKPRAWWLRWLPKRRTWIVIQPFVWCGPASHPVCITVPAGFVTDFASIPFFVFLLSPMNGMVSDYGRSAVIHDYLYVTGLVGRERADDTFYSAMLCEDVLWPTRVVMWAAVRCFGWWAYRPRPL